MGDGEANAPIGKYCTKIAVAPGLLPVDWNPEQKIAGWRKSA